MAKNENKIGNDTSNARKEAFARYAEADERVEKARQELEAAMASRSVIVKGILEKFGAGPFRFQGRLLKAQSRKSTDDDGNVTAMTFFFKSLGEEVQDV